MIDQWRWRLSWFPVCDGNPGSQRILRHFLRELAQKVRECVFPDGILQLGNLYGKLFGEVVQEPANLPACEAHVFVQLCFDQNQLEFSDQSLAMRSVIAFCLPFETVFDFGKLLLVQIGIQVADGWS